MATAFAQDTAKAASTRWRAVADRLRPEVPKLADVMDDAGHDVPTCMTFPREHRAGPRSATPIERPNGEIRAAHQRRRRLPDDDAILRLSVAARRSGTPAPDVMAILEARYIGQWDTILLHTIMSMKRSTPSRSRRQGCDTLDLLRQYPDSGSGE
ncbi:transposase [Jannaschia rubra]|uniref:transposase n=2 Tax=Jannaschia rubra TaxID=282197 RepID=UPI00352158A7